MSTLSITSSAAIAAAIDSGKLLLIPGKCGRCSCKFSIAVESAGRYETHCPDCDAWIPVDGGAR